MKDFDNKIKNKLSSFQHEESPSEESVQKMLSGLDEVLPTDPKVKSIGNSNSKKATPFFMMKIAASITLLVVIGYLTLSLNQVNVVVGNRAHQEVTLPDGSTVVINSDSELSFNKLRWYVERKVELKGEAFFKVAKGEEFTVVSEQGNTQVLGTSFNVFARKKRYKVTCRTGKVSVSSTANDKSVVLTPGKGVNIEGGTINKFEFDSKKPTDWIQGEFFFNAARFDNIINELERQYDLKVSYPDEYKGTLYTGYFNNRNLDQALKLICEPMELSYKIEGNNIVLSSSD